MSSVKPRGGASKPNPDRRDSVKANNALQSDFGETDGSSSLDADERYLVRASNIEWST